MAICLNTTIDTPKEKRPVFYARRTWFDVFQKGLYVGSLELSPDQVRELTAQAVFILKPVELK